MLFPRDHKHAVAKGEQHGEHAWIGRHEPVQLLNGRCRWVRRSLIENIPAPEDIIDQNDASGGEQLEPAAIVSNIVDFIRVNKNQVE